MALDDQIRETVSRHLEELLQAARDATRVATEAAEAASTQAARDVEEQRAQFAAEIEGLQHRIEEVREDGQRRIDESQAEIETLRGDLESAQKQLDTTRDDVEATLRDIEAARRDSDAARAELSRLEDVLRGSEARAEQALRLPEAVRALDEAATFGEVLGTLAVRAGREAGRAAVFLVKGDRLRDWRTVGFDLPSDVSRLDISVDESGPMAEAVRSAEGVQPQKGSPVPDFARTDEEREAAAWPVSVGGSVVAVLYADGPVADKPGEPYWPAFLDVLARHAGRVLEGITVRQAAGLVADRASFSISRQAPGSIQ